MLGRARCSVSPLGFRIECSSIVPVASGASLFVFDGAATHHPPRSVTDAEQLLIVALRAAINSYPATSRRSATNADHRRPRADRLDYACGAIAELHGMLVIVRTARTNRSVQVETLRLARSLIAASNRRAQPLGPRCRSQALISASDPGRAGFKSARSSANLSTQQINGTRSTARAGREVAT